MQIARRFLIAAALLGAATFGQHAAAQQHKWRLQGFVPASFTVNQEFAKWAAALKAKSGGQIEIELVPVGAVVGVTETLDAVRNGILSGQFSAASYSSAKDPAFAIVGDTMAAYESAAQKDRWWTEGGGLAIMRKLYAQHGGYLIGPVHAPAEQLVSKKPLRTVDDFKGLKIRGVQGTVGDLFTRVGAGVVVLPGSEILTALQTGAVDAADWAWPQMNEQSGLHKVAPFSIDMRHSMGSTEIVVSMKAWNALSAAQKQLVEGEVAAFSKHMLEVYTRENSAAIARLKAGGVQFIELSTADYSRVRKLTFEIFEEYAKRSPAAREVVDSNNAFLKKLGLI